MTRGKPGMVDKGENLETPTRLSRSTWGGGNRGWNEERSGEAESEGEGQEASYKRLVRQDKSKGPQDGVAKRGPFGVVWVQVESQATSACRARAKRRPFLASKAVIFGVDSTGPQILGVEE